MFFMVSDSVETREDGNFGAHREVRDTFLGQNSLLAGLRKRRGGQSPNVQDQKSGALTLILTRVPALMILSLVAWGRVNTSLEKKVGDSSKSELKIWKLTGSCK